MRPRETRVSGERGGGHSLLARFDHAATLEAQQGKARKGKERQGREGQGSARGGTETCEGVYGITRDTHTHFLQSEKKEGRG